MTTENAHRKPCACASGGLGYSLPAAVGVAMARGREQRVIGLFGDGASMYAIQALWSAAQLQLPMTIIIVNNGGYAALDQFAGHFGWNFDVRDRPFLLGVAPQDNGRSRRSRARQCAFHSTSDKSPRLELAP